MADYRCLDCGAGFHTDAGMNAHINDRHPTNYGMTDTFGIEMTCTFIGQFTDPADDRYPLADRWEHNLWDCFLTRELHGNVTSMSVKMRRGMGLSGEPTLIEVLNAIQISARIDEDDEYDEILADIPYSKAKAQAEAIKAEADDVRAFVGDVYESFLEQEYNP